jgi:transposase
MPGDSTKRYPLELKQRAVRMVAEIAGEHDSKVGGDGSCR